jgi:two-component system chemotaxis response regulator CheB
MQSEVASMAPESAAIEPPRPVIVALVCSAGGLKALSTVLGGLPLDFAAAVIVLQHQHPDQRGYLASLLAHRCRLPVSIAFDGSRLQAGTVQVVPPGTHALVTDKDNIALISSDGPPPYRPSADLLLTSLALVAPARSIAVILSGSGNDGATGAAALHHFGGKVVASDLASSEYIGMPAAAIGRDEIVDHVLPLSQIADTVVELVLQTVADGALDPT